MTAGGAGGDGGAGRGDRHGDGSAGGAERGGDGERRDGDPPQADASSSQPPHDSDEDRGDRDGSGARTPQDRSVDTPPQPQPTDPHPAVPPIEPPIEPPPVQSRDATRGGPPGERAITTAPGPRVEGPDRWDRAAAWTMSRGALPAVALITLAMVAIYAHMFAGELAGDDLTFHMAESARLADCLRVGDFDFWNPSANGGFASAYYYQVVPQLMSAIPAAVFGHHVFFFELSVFLPLVLAPLAAYRGMRLLGATPWQAAIAALAIGFTNGESRWGTGNAGTFNVGLYTQTWALAAFPLALGHAVRWATRGRGLAPAIAWGTFVALCHPFAGFGLGIALFAGWIAQIFLAAIDLVLGAIGSRLHGDPARGAWSAMLASLGERWRHLPPRTYVGELVRLAALGICLVIACVPFWLPLVLDYVGFGGFPHRVGDEVGPGFTTLFKWYRHGGLLDFSRPQVLTWVLPVVLLFARGRMFRWLWAPAMVYAVWLGMGPHLGKTDDDLIPAVRFLGAMQVVLSLAVGAGFLGLCRWIWDAPEGSPLHRVIRAALDLASFGRLRDRDLPLQYAVRTGVAAAAAALGVLLALPGAHALAARVRVLPDFPNSHGVELRTIAMLLQSQPAGRKQVGPGAENHWWNLLSYEYGRRPSLLMMGGGGLQASPNYDFLWNTSKDFTRNAWVFDAPILVFQKANAGTMPSGELVFETKNVMVRRLPAPGLVSPVEITGALPDGNRRAVRTAAIAWFKSDQALKDRVLAYPGFGGVGAASGPPRGTVTRAVRQDSPGDEPDIVAEVEAEAPTTYMARESWHPRWHAYVDGAEAPIRRVTPDFSAVDVPAGHHTLAFRFHRPWWAHAAWLVWPALSLLGWLATRRRRAARTTVALT
jgi:hypothetical protein